MTSLVLSCDPPLPHPHSSLPPSPQISTESLKSAQMPPVQYVSKCLMLMVRSTITTSLRLRSAVAVAFTDATMGWCLIICVTKPLRNGCVLYNSLLGWGWLVEWHQKRSGGFVFHSIRTHWPLYVRPQHQRRWSKRRFCPWACPHAFEYWKSPSETSSLCAFGKRFTHVNNSSKLGDCHQSTVPHPVLRIIDDSCPTCSNCWHAGRPFNECKTI